MLADASNKSRGVSERLTDGTLGRSCGKREKKDLRRRNGGLFCGRVPRGSVSADTCGGVSVFCKATADDLQS